MNKDSREEGVMSGALGAAGKATMFGGAVAGAHMAATSQWANDYASMNDNAVARGLTKYNEGVDSVKDAYAKRKGEKGMGDFKDYTVSDEASIIKRNPDLKSIPETTTGGSAGGQNQTHKRIPKHNSGGSDVSRELQNQIDAARENVINSDEAIKRSQAEQQAMNAENVKKRSNISPVGENLKPNKDQVRDLIDKEHVRQFKSSGGANPYEGIKGLENARFNGDNLAHGFKIDPGATQSMAVNNSLRGGRNRVRTAPTVKRPALKTTATQATKKQTKRAANKASKMAAKALKLL